MKNYFTIFLSRQTILAVLILLLGFCFRAMHLTGDAPAGDISRSGVFYTDEGTYAHNAVNKALFGTWFLRDDYNAVANVPVFSLFQYATMKVLGIGLVPIRLGAVFYSLVSLLLLWSILKAFDHTAAIIALVLGVSNYFFIIYNRLALLENLLILFLVIITGFLFRYHQRQKARWLMLATIFFVIGYFVKATIVFFLPVFLMTIYHTYDCWKKRIFQLAIFASTSVILVAVWVHFWIFPHFHDWQYFQQLNISQKFPNSLLQVLVNYARYAANLKLFAFMPVTYTNFLFYAAFLVIAFFKRRRLSFPELFFLTWAFSGILFLGFFAYSPPRFSLVLIPPIISLVAIFLSKLKQNQLDFRLLGRYLWLVLVIVGLICCVQVIFGIYRIARDHHQFLSCYLPLLSLPLLLVLFRANKILLPQKYAGMLLAAMLVINLFQIGQYHANMKFSCYRAIKDMQRFMEAFPGRPKVLAGDIAPFVATELKVKAVNIIFRPEAERQRFLRIRPNYLVLQDSRELKRLKQKMPVYLADIQLLKTYSVFNNYINDQDIHFYRIK